MKHTCFHASATDEVTRRHRKQLHRKEEGEDHDATTTPASTGRHGWRSRLLRRQENVRTRSTGRRPRGATRQARHRTEPAAAEEAPPETGDDDMVKKLTQFKELHDSGVLTDEEFAAAKQKVLSGS